MSLTYKRTNILLFFVNTILLEGLICETTDKIL